MHSAATRFNSIVQVLSSTKVRCNTSSLSGRAHISTRHPYICFQLPYEVNLNAAASYPGAHLSKAINVKIRSDEFVDFNELKKFDPYQTTTDTLNNVCAVKKVPKKRKELT